MTKVQARRFGFVSSRAGRFRSVAGRAAPLRAASRGFKDGQHGHSPSEVKQTAAEEGGNVLVVAGLNAEKVAELVITATEPSRRAGTLKPKHGPVLAFQAAVVPLQPIVKVAARPVPHRPAPLGADRAWVAVVTVRCHPSGRDARHRPGRAKVRLGGRHVAAFAEQHVHERAGAVDGAVDVSPAPSHPQVSLIDLPTPSDLAVPTTPEVLGHRRG